MKELTVADFQVLYEQYKNDPFNLICAAFELGYERGKKVSEDE